MTDTQAREGEASDNDEAGAAALASGGATLGAESAARSAAVSGADTASNAPPDTSAQSLATRLAAWRSQQPASADPLGAAFINNLARHAETQLGPVRRLLEGRLIDLITAHEDRPASPAVAAAPASPMRQPRPRSQAHAALAALVEQLARQSAPPLSADRPSATDEALASLGGPPDLKAMGYFRSTWSRLSAERRLTQSLARVPDKAGPLNAQQLVHQTLAMMRELSPGYLNHFLDHADTLMWLERAQSAPALGAAIRGGKGGKAAAKNLIVKRGGRR